MLSSRILDWPVKGNSQLMNFTFNYNLSADELVTLENQLIDIAIIKGATDGLIAFWISPTSPFSNIVRTYESLHFPEVEGVSEGDELTTLFLCIMDMRLPEPRVVHAASTSNYDELKSGKHGDSTGFYTVDQLIRLGNFTAREFEEYYNKEEVALSACISVETNFRVGEHTDKYRGFPVSNVAYKALYAHAKSRALESGEPGLAGIFSSINEASKRSFTKFGIEYRPLMGRTNLKTPEEVFGLEYQPVFIPESRKNSLLLGLAPMPKHTISVQDDTQ